MVTAHCPFLLQHLSFNGYRLMHLVYPGRKPGTNPYAFLVVRR